MKGKAYLKNGEEVLLHQRLDSGECIVERYITFYEYDGQENTDLSGVKEVVAGVFMEAPIGKKSNEFIELIKKVEDKNRELASVEMQIMKAKRELAQIEKYKTDLEKHIINKSEIRNAKTLTVFDGYTPKTLSDKDKESLRISYSIDVNKGVVSGWVYDIYSDGGIGFGTSIDNEIGILVNATEEEVLEIGKNKIIKNASKISEWDLKRIPDEFLTDELLARKADYALKERQSKIDRLQDRINEASKEIDDLKNKEE